MYCGQLMSKSFCIPCDFYFSCYSSCPAILYSLHDFRSYNFGSRNILLSFPVIKTFLKASYSLCMLALRQITDVKNSITLFLYQIFCCNTPLEASLAQTYGLPITSSIVPNIFSYGKENTHRLNIDRCSYKKQV